MDSLKQYLTKFKNFGENELEKFDLFYNFLTEENKKYNLTTITKPEDFAVKHILDSVMPIDLFVKNAKVVDIGCGAGFPSVPLKIVRDDLNFTLLDSVNKKVSFCNLAVEKLNLKNIKAEHCRIEDFAIKNSEKFDICCSRAVASLPTLLEYALPLLKVGGVCIFYKSQKLEEEIDLSKNALKILGGKITKTKQYDLQDNQRKILVVQKIKPCPKGYPRGQNKPRTKPL